jgi:hypothetical protein
MNPTAPLLTLLVFALLLRLAWLVLVDGNGRSLGDGPAGRSLTRAIAVVAVLQAVVWIARFFGAFGGPVAV